MVNAFDKSCAPGNEEIGDYNLVDDCNFPGPETPIVTPVDPPIPIPPVDPGCFPFDIDGDLFVPGDSSAVPGGLNVDINYIDDDQCQPDIDISLNIPCFVNFAAGSGTVLYDIDASEALVEFDVVGGDTCDFALDLNLTLPCPTEITGGTGTVAYDPAEVGGSVDINVAATPGTCDFELGLDLVLPCPTDLTGGAGTVSYRPDVPGGSVVLQASQTPGTCDFELALDAVLPCPGTITATTTLGEQTQCLPRQPSIGVTVTNVTEMDSSSSEVPTCSFNLDFELDIPCPIQFQPASVVVTSPNVYGVPTGQLLINPADALFLYISSSSIPQPTSSGVCDEAQDCTPEFQLKLNMPCPANFEDLAGAVDFNAYDSVSDVPQDWAIEPDAKLSVNYSNGQVCDPVLDVSLNLPCPIKLSTDDADPTVNVKDSLYYADAPSPPEPPVRQWAHGQPTAVITLSLDSVNSVGSTETECLPILDVSLNLPCPAGGLHRTPVTDGELSLQTWRQANAYATDPDHPNYDVIPAGTVQFGDQPLLDDDLINQERSGLFGRLDFDNDCKLNIDVSLDLPCSHRDIDVKVYDIDTGAEMDPALGYAEIRQDWANTGTNPCAFEDDIDIWLKPGGGSSGGGGGDTMDVRVIKWREITSNDGGRQYLYKFEQVTINDLGLYSVLPGGVTSDNVIVVAQPAVDARGALLTTPTPGVVISVDDSPTVQFAWSAATSANGEFPASYRLLIGTTPGGSDIYDSGSLGTGTLSVNVTETWPANDSDVYATIRTTYDGLPVPSVINNNYVYGGTESIKNLLVHMTGVTSIPDDIGTQPDGVSDLEVDATLRIKVLGGGPVPWPVPLGFPESDCGIPENKMVVLAQKTGSSNFWKTYASIPRYGLCANPPPQRAEDTNISTVSSPVDGSTLVTSSQTFMWSSVTDASYIIYAGDEQGNDTYFNSALLATTSISVTGLPEDGTTVFIRLWTLMPTGMWFFNDYRYTANS